jgi:hypothetical protein
MPLGALPDYMQGMMSPEEFIRSSREQGISDFDAQNAAPAGQLGTLSSRSLFGGNTGQNGPLVTAVNKYNYAQRDAYQKAMLAGTQQAHNMNLQNTQQAQQMLNDNRNFGLNRQNVLGQQYLRSQELQQQARQEEGRLGLDTSRLGLDTRVHSDMMPIRQQQANTETARQTSDDRLGTGRLALDTQVHQDRTGLEQGRLDLDTSLGMRRATTDELSQQANAGIGYANAKTSAQQANTEAARVANEGAIGQGQLGVNQYQAETQRAGQAATAYNENEANIARHADVAIRGKLGKSDLEERERQRQGDYFLSLQARQNELAEINARKQAEMNRLGLDQQHYLLAQKRDELTNMAKVRELDNGELQTLLDYNLKLKDLENRKTQVTGELSLGRRREQTNLEATRSRFLSDRAANRTNRIGQNIQAQGNLMNYAVGQRGNEILAGKTQQDLNLRQQEIELAREKQAVEGAFGAQKLELDSRRSNWEREALRRSLGMKERQQNLDERSKLEDRLLRLREIGTGDRAISSQEKQSAAHVAQARRETVARQGIAHEQAKIEREKTLVSRQAMDYKEAFNQEQLKFMRDKLHIEEEQLRTYQRDVETQNHIGIKAFELRAQTALHNHIEGASNTQLARAGFLVHQASQESDTRIREQQLALAREVAANAHQMALENLAEMTEGRYDRRDFNRDATRLAERDLANQEAIARANAVHGDQQIALGERSLDTSQDTHRATVRSTEAMQRKQHEHEARQSKASIKAQKDLQESYQDYDLMARDAHDRNDRYKAFRLAEMQIDHETRMQKADSQAKIEAENRRYKLEQDHFLTSTVVQGIARFTQGLGTRGKGDSDEL